MTSELSGFASLIFIIFFNFGRYSLMFTKLDWNVLDLWNKAWISIYFPCKDEKTRNSAELWENTAASGISQSVLIACHLALQTFSRLLTVWCSGTVSHVSVQLTGHTSPYPQSPSTSDSSCLRFSCRGWANNKMMKLITHINATAPYAQSVYMNGPRGLIHHWTFNPVPCKWARASASLQSNPRHEHARKAPKCCEGLKL